MTITEITHNPLVAYAQLVSVCPVKIQAYDKAFAKAYAIHKCILKARKFALIKLRQRKII